MFSRKSLVMALALVVLGLGTTVSIDASPRPNTRVRDLNRAVSLPGVTLRAGTYIFEAPGAEYDHDSGSRPEPGSLKCVLYGFHSSGRTTPPG
jgi:hypothetical protein